MCTEAFAAVEAQAHAPSLEAEAPGAERREEEEGGRAREDLERRRGVTRGRSLRADGSCVHVHVHADVHMYMRMHVLSSVGPTAVWG